MHPTHFARLTIHRDVADEVRHEYLDWVLGEGRYRNARRRRQQVGLPTALRRDELASGGDFRGEQDFRLFVRTDDRELRLHLVHRDHPDVGRQWHTAARVVAQDSGVAIEHAVAQAWDRDRVPAPVAAPPQVLRRLVEAWPTAIAPRELAKSGVTHVRSDEAESYVRHVVLDPARELPIVAVSAETASGRPFVDSKTLSSALETLAAVIELDDAASYAWADALETARGDRLLGRCFGGAIRLYRAPMLREQSSAVHYLWHPERVEAHLLARRGDPIAAARDCAAEVAQQIVGRTLPHGFFRLIETFDRDRAAERARQALARKSVVQVIVRKPAIEDGPAVIELREMLELEQAEAQSLRASLVETRAECGAYVEEIDALERERGRLAQVVAELEQERDGLRAELARASRDSGVGPTARTKAALRAAFVDGEPTLEQALVVLETLVPDRVRVLPTAYASARRSAEFNRTGKAWELLWRLANEWWTAMASGGGDDRARRVFTPAQYAARESDTVEGNRVGRERRTFDIDGRPTPMWRHLKIGVKDSLTETWRCHFEWLPDERRIAIGHCGGHLDFE